MKNCLTNSLDSGENSILAMATFTISNPKRSFQVPAYCPSFDTWVARIEACEGNCEYDKLLTKN